MKIIYRIIILFVVGIFVNLSLQAQELEPRSLTNVPIGSNFAVLGYAYSQGNILLDPSIPIENLDAKINILLGGYVRSINFFGLSSKVDVMVPFATGHWTGVYEGVDTATARTGFGDPSVRLSVNLLGAPALKPSEYSKYQQKTIIGLSIRVFVPLGQYNPDKLLNLGSNRWTIALKAGLSQKFKNWVLEFYLGSWFFTQNNDFIGGNTLTQKPYFTGLVHLIRSLPKNMWLAANLGYGIGGQGEVNGELKDNRMSTFRFGLTYAVSFAKSHTVKLNIFSSSKLEAGPDFDSMALVYSYRWNRK